MDVAAESKPKLRRGVRLVHNEARGSWVLLAPEKIFKIDPIGAEILKRCDGENTLAEIVSELAAAYSAPSDRVGTDIAALLKSLAEKQLLDL